MDSLVPSLPDLALFKSAAAVRELALQCIMLLLELPWSYLHRHAPHVTKVLSQAADDNKRAVRQQAVKCRHAWSSQV